MRRPTDTLTRRLVLLGVVTAMVSVLGAALIGVPLVQSAALTLAQERLSQQADAVSTLLAGSLADPDQLVAVAAELDRQMVDAYVVTTRQTPPTDAPLELLDEALSDGEAGGVVADPDRLVEARRVGPGSVLVLQSPQDVAVSEVASPLLERLGVALLVGLLVAVVAGIVASQRLARPLRVTADAARRMSRGERSVRVPPEGPAEVAEVADALNGLADALERSETRQRRFLLSVSHELRTPLTSVRGYAEALADGVLTGPEAERAGRVVGAEADRLDHLMSDLLALARAEADDFALDLARVDLADVVNAVSAAWTEPARRASLRWSTEVPPTPVVALADPVRARQVVDALVSNALRITPPDRPVVVATFVDGAGHGVLQVRDGGPGLTDDDLAVAFDHGVLRDRYEGTRPGGSGIGLALVDRLVRRMGGTVAAGHAPEGGAAFTVTFPEATGEPERGSATGGEGVPGGVPSAR